FTGPGIEASDKLIADSTHFVGNYLVSNLNGPFSDNRNFGFLVEDTAARQIYWFQQLSDSIDLESGFLMYDFSLQTGDTIEVALIVDWYGGTPNPPYPYNRLVVDSISTDSVYSLNNGLLTGKTLYLSTGNNNGYGKVIWNERVGNLGYFSAPSLGEGMSRMVCFTRDSVRIYTNWWAGQFPNPDFYCFDITSIDESLEDQVSLSPNPTRGPVSISLRQVNVVQQIELFNQKGQQLFSRKISPQEVDIQLSLNELPAGLYFVQAHSTRGTQSFKLIKQ
ncbi:MAG: T9SS type A sorting domain-containing protein, partial [Bacteroidota bacterium]